MPILRQWLKTTNIHRGKLINPESPSRMTVRHDPTIRNAWWSNRKGRKCSNEARWNRETRRRNHGTSIVLRVQSDRCRWREERVPGWNRRRVFPTARRLGPPIRGVRVCRSSHLVTSNRNTSSVDESGRKRALLLLVIMGPGSETRQAESDWTDSRVLRRHIDVRSEAQDVTRHV